MGIPGLFDGEHIFEIEPAGAGRTRFVQREVFRGLLVPVLARSLDRDTKRGFEEMNRALKMRAELGVPETHRSQGTNTVQR
ncbi:MAG TPA: SRPBCC domain-containing protein [Thermoplasmata archaeon]|nr:SRPBCC domain-containing protein [Thermoplasmata archaeon]